MKKVKYGEITVYEWSIFTAYRDRIITGVTGRSGGVTTGRFSSFNLGLHVGDNPAHVVANRQLLCEGLGVDFDRFTCARQTHGANVRLVTPELAGRGRDNLEDSLPDVDALVTQERGITINICLADCTPLVFYNPSQHIGAVVHAGWQGTALLIAQQAMHFLQIKFSCRPADILVGIGPGIGACCYQVNADVLNKLYATFPYAPDIFKLKEQHHLYPNIAEANYQQLRAVGVPPGNIDVAELCTYCGSDDFFSERKLGRPTGRFACFLSLK